LQEVIALINESSQFIFFFEKNVLEPLDTHNISHSVCVTKLLKHLIPLSISQRVGLALVTIWLILSVFYSQKDQIKQIYNFKIVVESFTCSGLLTGSLPVDILSTGLMTLEPEDEVEGETVVGIICSDEP
jgi:hypothetical protein